MCLCEEVGNWMRFYDKCVCGVYGSSVVSVCLVYVRCLSVWMCMFEEVGNWMKFYD